MTAVAGVVYTAANWNTHIKDNLNAIGVALMTTDPARHLGTTGANAVAERSGNIGTVATGQTTTNTSFVDLATAGPAITMTTSTNAMITFGAMVSSATAGQGGRVGVALSGSNTQAAGDTNSLCMESGNVNDAYQFSWFSVYTIAAGSTTWTLKYRSVGGATASFSNRWITGIPF